MSTTNNDGKKSVLTNYLRELGRKGGKAAAVNRTAAERKEHARKAALVRWAKHKKVKM